ncbi:MAG: acyltransferase family protein [Microthrixaceae bacterium]
MITTARPWTRVTVPRALGLDALRALAAFGVLVTHVGFVSGVVNEDRIGSSLRLLIPRLDVGVSIFFVLSGLLVTRPFVRSFLDEGPRPGLRDYARRRLSRIYPLYWVVLAATLMLASGPRPPLLDLLGDVALVHIYRPSTAIGPITQAWSLATEVAFYAFVPAWFAACRWWSARQGLDRPGRVRLLAVGLVGWVLIALLWRLGVVATTTTYDFTDPTAIDTRGALLTWLPNHLDTFALGAAFALLIELGRVPRFGVPARLASYGVAAAALWIASVHLDLPPLFTGFDGPQTLVRHALFVLCAAALVAPSVHALGARRTAPIAEPATARRVAQQLVVGAALASYGVYLWHQLVTDQWFERQGLADFQAPFATALLVVTVVSVGLAAATYWAVERPAADLATGRTGRDRRDPQPLGRHPRLDALRGMAVLAVLGTHIVFLDDGSDRWSLRGGFLGVDVFLVLSGFLIGAVLLEQMDRRGSIDGGRFTRRRVRRLVPALVVFLAIESVVAVALGTQLREQLEQIGFALTFTANLQLSWGIQPPFALVHLWSLSLEVQFYVLLALIVGCSRRVLDRSRAAVCVLVLAAVCVALWRLFLFQRGIEPVALYERPDARADSMLLGLAAAVAWRAGLVQRRAVLVAGAAGAPVLAVSAVVATPDAAWLFSGGFTLVAAASAAVVLAFTADAGPMARVGDVRVLRWFGMISYSLYLWHLPIYLWTVRAMPDAPLWQVVLVAVPAAIAAGALSFHLVERHTLAGWRRRMDRALEHEPIRHGEATTGDAPVQRDTAAP